MPNSTELHMGATTLNLNQYTYSDVFTVEIDNSQTTALPLTTGRVIIGSSRVGPMNTVVQITNSLNALNVFGPIDTKLEAKGSFFHRTIQTSLKQGPVYAMNVLPVSTANTANFVTFNTDFSGANTPSTLAAFTQPIANFFNTQRFWKADSDSLTFEKNSVLTGADATKIFSFANLSQSGVTVFCHRTSISGYNITAAAYYALYGNGNGVPFFINPDDNINDYFVELIVVQGDYSNSIKLSQDPINGQFFTPMGLIESKVQQFLNQNTVTVIIRASGSLIPDFIDQTGNNASIDTIINNTYTRTNVLAAIDENSVDLMDLSIATFNSSNVDSQRIDTVGYGYNEMIEFVDDQITGLAQVPLIDVLGYKKPVSGTFNFIVIDNPPYGRALGFDNLVPHTGSVDSYVKAYEGSSLYNAFQSGFTINSDLITGPSSNAYVKYIDGFTDVVEGVTVPYVQVTAYSDKQLTNQIDITTVQNSTGGGTDYLTITSQVITYSFSKTFNMNDTTNFFSSWSYTAPNVLTFSLVTGITAPNLALVNQYFKVGQYLQAQVNSGTERNRLLPITAVGSTTNPTTSVVTYTVTTAAPADNNNRGILTSGSTVTCVVGSPNFLSNVRGVYMPPFVVTSNLLPDGSAAREDVIMGFVLNGSNLGNALADKQSVDFRYFIDSYQGQIEQSSKYWLAQLAANHTQAFSIANAPSMKQFMNSTVPSFIDPTTGLVSAAFIAVGGNLSLNPNVTFSFAQGVGPTGVSVQTYIGYFMPNLMINDNGRIRSIPSSAYIGNLYMQKFVSGNTFNAVAGPKRGTMNDSEITGLEYNFTDQDRAVLEPAGFNMIIQRRGYGNVLMGQYTAYQSVVSALNNIHVRDTLITIERDINTLLFNYLFDFNDETVQLQVRTQVQNYLDAVMSAGGITTYTVAFNSTNNTPAVLAANTAIVDIGVTFPSAINKFINRITINGINTAGVSATSTGFIPSF